ncbi:MAG: hypothetical protein WB499_03550, partial [Pseudolabrys sp.]
PFPASAGMSGVRVARAPISDVMRGLDPRIHDESQQVQDLDVRQSFSHGRMDCRAKPGNDG